MHGVEELTEAGTVLRDMDAKLHSAMRRLIPDRKEIVLTFPLGAKNDRTAWKIRWAMEPYQIERPGEKGGRRDLFCIKGAWFRAAPTADWLQVLGDARVSETFTAYDDGATAYSDM